MVHMGTTRTMLTFEEFESLPDRPGKQELLRGELIDLPPAELRHNRIAHLIYELLKAALNQAHTRGEALDLGEVFHEMGYQLAGHSWVQPDVSVTHAGQGEGKYFAGAPAIAVEVVSPSNSAEDMDTKAELYFQFGAREVWRVYPEDPPRGGACEKQGGGCDAARFAQHADDTGVRDVNRRGSGITYARLRALPIMK
jgi:Uma2 family endonuclease